MRITWGLRMIVLVTIFSTLFYGVMASCCISPQKRHPEPKRPDSVRGWRDAEFSGVHSIAELVLKKGESSDNGSLGVQVVDIIAPDRCAEPNSYLGSPRVIVRFFRPSDRMKLCEATLIEGGSGLDSPTCDKEFGVTVIYINAINTKEGWLWFELRK